MAFGKKKGPSPVELYEAAVDAYERARLDDYSDTVPGVMLKKGEHAYLIVEGVGYIEPKRLPSTWQGGSRGVSFRIAKGVNYRVGATKGQMKQGEEVLQATDSGTFVATNQRFLFVGSKRTTEWALSKLVGFSLDGTPGTAVFNVTNRQKPSGLLYGVEHEQKVEAVIAAIIAREQSPTSHAALLSELADEVRGAADAAGLSVPQFASQPELPAGSVWAPPQAEATQPAGWLPDPQGRFEYRWWDGQMWTANVSRGGQVYEDPV